MTIPLHTTCPDCGARPGELCAHRHADSAQQEIDRLRHLLAHANANLREEYNRRAAAEGHAEELVKLLNSPCKSCGGAR